MRQHTVQTPYLAGETHCYSIELQGELVLFDTGPATDEAWATLAGELDLRRLRHIFITHCHVDHYGLARRLAAECGATVYLPASDVLKRRHHDKRLAFIATELQACGFTADEIARFRGVIDNNRIFPGYPERFQVVEESPEPARLGIEVLACPGHSQSDLVYLVGGWAVTGDILLRDLFQSPLLDFDLQRVFGRFNNYRAYCASLRRLAPLRGRHICPGHRRAVAGLDETVLAYVSKLRDRAARLAAAPAGVSLRELIDRLPGRSDDPFVTYLKASELLFMRDYLAEPRLLDDALSALGGVAAIPTEQIVEAS